MRYVKLAPGNDRPLCPNGAGGPTNPAHELRVRLINAAYEASERDADGEYADPAVERVNTAIAYGERDDRMHLYVSEVAVDYGGRHVVVEAWFFRCPVCGLILPAGRQQ